MVKLAVWVVLVVALAACGSRTVERGAVTGTLIGRVIAAPMCPVARPGVACRSAAVVATIRAKNSRGRVLAATRTDARGTYRLQLPPGAYKIVAINAKKLPRCTAANVTVRVNHTTTRMIACDVSLRALATARGLTFGTAADAIHLTGDRYYTKVLSGQFNSLTPEYEMYWDGIEPRQNQFSFGPTDALVKFAKAHAMTVRGHVLVWHLSNPSWLTSGAFDAEQLSTVLEHHIDAVVGRYAGKIAQWDVVNEAFDDAGNLRSDVWGSVLGERYIADAFTDAHRADPKAKLFYNDYNIEFPGPKADAVFAEVKRLKAQHVPIDGVGFQMHAIGGRGTVPGFPAGQLLAVQMRRYRQLGLDVAVTELDERMPLPASADDLAQQKTEFQGALSACLEAANCHTFNMWGFTDKYSWIPSWYPGFGAATMLGPGYGVKPAYQGLRSALLGS